MKATLVMGLLLANILVVWDIIQHWWVVDTVVIREASTVEAFIGHLDRQ